MTKVQKTIIKKAKSQAKEAMADKSLKRKDRKAQANAIMAEATTQVDNIDKARNVNGKKNLTCYVCGRKINNGSVYIGDGMYRHGSCEAGSTRWMDSKIGQESRYRRHFLTLMTEV